MKILAILSIAIALFWGIDGQNCNAAAVFLFLMLPTICDSKKVKRNAKSK